MRNCIQQVGIASDEAFRMASTYPARQLGMDDQLGYLKPGYVANIVALTSDLTVQEVFTAW